MLITYSNDNYYLNVKMEFDEKKGYTFKNVEWKHWNDLKDIDFNGWWKVENDVTNDRVCLRHYNTN